jgi:hypothetical protein
MAAMKKKKYIYGLIFQPIPALVAKNIKVLEYPKCISFIFSLFKTYFPNSTVLKGKPYDLEQ